MHTVSAFDFGICKKNVTATRPYYKLLLIIVAIFALTGCPQQFQTELDEELAANAWNSFTVLNESARKASSPYNASISFRLTMPEESYVLGAYLWSNNTLNSQHPMRLDLQSSVGSTVAKMKEEPDYFLLYDVQNNMAIVSNSAEIALASIKVPMPFMLGDVSLLLNGRYADFFTAGKLEQLVLTETTINRESVFEITEGDKTGYLTLNAKGYPVKWQSATQNGWSMELAFQDITTLVANVTPLPGPKRITLRHPDGYGIAMQVKSLKKMPKPFADKQLELLVPTGATVREIKNKVSAN